MRFRYIILKNFNINIVSILQKIGVILILSTFCFLNSTCRKVSKNHSEYIGEWQTQQEYYPCTTIINIASNDRAYYGSRGSVDGCGYNWGGKARIIGNYLFIGYVKLKIIQKPVYFEDSLYFLPSSYYKTKVYASMIVKTTVLHNSATYTLFKVK